MELGDKAGMAAQAGAALTTEKQSSSHDGLAMFARRLHQPMSLFLMLFVLLNLMPRFAATVDDSEFMPSSELSSLLLCDLAGEGLQ